MVHQWVMLWVALLLGAGLLPSSSIADEIRPALLDLNEREGGWVDVTWKVPMRGDRILPLKPVFPEFFDPATPPAGRPVSGAWVEYSSYRTGGNSLTGATLAVDGLLGVSTDVLVRVRLIDGSEHSAVLRASQPEFTIPSQPSKGEVAVSYWQMGTIHILEGVDHLLFLLVLLLIVTGIWPLLKTVTAFTVAHSLTLALATLGVVNIPTAPTEAVISLSIVLLAVEAVRKLSGELTMAERYPWIVAFTFGLVHGLGFAGALSEIGVPQNEVPLALLMFNVGVETGQVMFVVAVSLLLEGLRRLHSSAATVALRAAPYAIGGIAAYWTIQRVDSFL
ncbi:MAG: HupE/UreJ family protein [Gammaproteobacteria bacterium]